MMKKLTALLLSLLLVSTMLVGLVLPAAAEDGDTILLTTTSAPVYTATFEDKTYEATPENASGAKGYQMTITSNAPAEVLRLVSYTVNGKAFEGATEPGTYTVTANLPEGLFVDEAGNALSTLTATLTLTKTTQSSGVIVFNADGSESSAYAEIKTTTVPADLLKKFAANSVRSFEIKGGVSGAKYLLLISLEDNLFAVKSKGLSEKSVYLFEDGKLTALTEKGYKVTLKDGRAEISGVAADAQMTVVIGVEKTSCPWWWIVIIIVVALLVCMFLVGRAKTKREEAAAKKAAEEEKKPEDKKDEKSSSKTPKKE
ncbi:MAG: hypothetical protein IJR88_00310 [Clostridia bacterium]|nr:hypothetical protein [Clostridia bacterium]